MASTAERLRLRAEHLTRRAKDRAAEFVADHLPEPIVYWATIRAIVHATTGRYSNQIVPELFAMDVLRRWPYPPLRIIGDPDHSPDERGLRFTAHPERVDERGGYDDRVQAADVHDCVWCPADVRDLFACAHNATVAVAAALEGTGEWPRARRKVTELIRCLERYQPDLDAHFGAARPSPPASTLVAGPITAYFAPAGTPPPPQGPPPGPPNPPRPPHDRPVGYAGHLSVVDPPRPAGHHPIA